MNKEELIKIFIDGPLKEYLTGDISYGRMIELINEKLMRQQEPKMIWETDRK